MLESDQVTIDNLLNSNDNFRRLYDKHQHLNAQIDEINAGHQAMEQLQLEALKKKKLLLRDQLQQIIDTQAVKH